MTTLGTANDGSERRPGKSGAFARLKDFLRVFLLRVRTSLSRRAPAPSWEQSFRVLRHHGFRPATVFDIGVAYGTYELYRAFPDAHHHLIDPTRESLHHMHQLHGGCAATFIPWRWATATGDDDRDPPGYPGRDASRGRDAARDPAPWACRSPRFDSLIGEIARPALAKIDVQGAELMVLEGMTGRMASIDAVIVETSTISSVKGGAEVHDVVRFMHDHGFVVADVVGMTRRPLDGATAQLDLLFLPDQHSPVRRDRRWSEAA